MSLLQELRNPNIFCAEHDRSQADVTTPLSLHCPHCRRLGSFNAVNRSGFTYHKKLNNNNITTFRATVRICPSEQCYGLVFVIENQGKIVEVNPPELLDFTLDNLPLQCQDTLKEAIACHAAGAYRASAMMVRRLLEEICDLNKAQGNNLHTRLEALKTIITLPQALFDAMSELKALGNDAAHIEAKAYDNIGREESEDSIELAKEILKALYQLQGLVSRLQSRKNKVSA